MIGHRERAARLQEPGFCGNQEPHEGHWWGFGNKESQWCGHVPTLEEEVSELVKAHTRYNVKCECGEFLLKRENGFMDSRDQWEKHFIEVLTESIGDG